MLLITALFVALALSAQSQPPSPAPTFKGSPQKEPSKGRAEQSTSYNHGAEDSPVFVKVIPIPKSQEETADDKAKYLDQSAANWWMVRLTLAVVFVGLIQTAVFALQARRLKQTVDKMDAIAAAQTADIQASINQATRAATAMEQIAISLNTQVGHMRTGLDLTRQSADAATQSAETAKRALVATQRALIVNTEINAGVVVDDISRQLVGFHFFAVFKNSGPTVALNAKCTASLIGGFRSIDNISHDAPAPIASDGSISVGPGVAFSADPIGISLDQIDRLRNNEVAFFIHGHVEYRDVFENTPTRITSVCARITLRDDPRIHTGEGFNTKAFHFKAGPSDHNCST